MNNDDRYPVESILDTLLASQDRLIRREIDASTCQTKYDWDQLHKAQDEHAEAYEAAILAIVQLVADARRQR